MAQPPDKVASTNIISQQDESVPSYITSAAAIISEALILESEEKYSESVEAYRSAIGKLLSEVQSDPDLIRQAAVKKRVAQYISKAEQLVERELDARCGPQTRQPTSSSHGIPHLHLFSHLSELRQYKVLDIIDGKVILAYHRETKQKVIFKVLHKSSAVYKKSKTSLLPINIKFMVNLLKYWETDNAVFLMLEYYPAGKLWHLVQPLVQQQLQEPGCERISVDLSQAEASNIPPFLKPSKSFIMTREKVASESLDTDSDLGDMNYVHSSNNSLLVISDQQIQHYSMDEEVGDHEREGERKSSSSQYTSNTERTYNSILDKMCQMEMSLKSRLQGVTSKEKRKMCMNQSSQSCDIVNNNPNINKFTPENSESFEDSVFYTNTIYTTIPKEDANSCANAVEGTNSCGNAVEDANSCANAVEGTNSCANAVEYRHQCTNLQKVTDDCARPETDQPTQNPPTNSKKSTGGSPKLRKLSKMLPRLPDSSLQQDTTGLPDRIIRLWAAELVKAITSLHYRDIIIKDLNPDNVLLDDSGHIKLSYQCEWVSVERTLSSTAVRGRFIAPEVLSPMEISRSADWWSFGAILLLLYTGEGPSSLIPSGLDSTIPISFPSYVSKDAIQFVSSFLEVNPERRLGASSTGHMDIRTHKYFNNFDWDQNMFTDKL